MKLINRLILTVILLLPLTAMAKEVVSIETLLKEMVNREEKARFPLLPYTCKQFSSYDRKSTERGGEGWFANGDYNQFIRTETQDGREEFVMMESSEPGSIVRFWMTLNGETERAGTLRIYVDDYETPAIEGTVFDVLSGNVVVGEPLAAGVSIETPRELRGHNLYMPIPYGKRCKVTFEYPAPLKRDESGKPVFPGYFFYNIGYRAYDPSVSVVSYSQEQLRANRALIEQVQRQLQEKNRETKRLKLTSENLDCSLAPDASRSFTIEGAQAIRNLRLQLKAANTEQALRSTVLEISFDNERTVWVPVGDFFGIGYKPLYTNTWYTHCTAEGMMESFWVMPFKENCTITLHNYSKEPVDVVNSSVAYSKWQWDDRSMHFGATWKLYDHQMLDRMIRRSGGECADVNFALLEGKGVYMGDAIALCNSTPGWWGEGDEKIFVDGETFPSSFGTGSEDYYGYAWCLSAPFTDHPFIAQPDGGGNNAPAFSANTRLRALDAIPFNRSIDVNLEQYNRINYAPVAYWYMLPGGHSATEPDIRGAKERVALSSDYFYKSSLELSIEAENMVRDDIPKNNVNIQSGFADLWSGFRQIYWDRITKGDRIKLSFESAYAGTHKLEGLFTLAPDYGSFDIWFNDQKVASSLNLYDKEVITQWIGLGEVELREGKNTLSIELVEDIPGAANCCFGIDKIKLTK